MVPYYGHAEPERVTELASGSRVLREAVARTVVAKHAEVNQVPTLDRMGSKALRDVLARAVLAKAGGDDTFFTSLAQEPDKILKGYDLNPEEREALAGGDISWLESKVKALRDPLGAWVALRLASNKEGN